MQELFPCLSKEFLKLPKTDIDIVQYIESQAPILLSRKQIAVATGLAYTTVCKALQRIDSTFVFSCQGSRGMLYGSRRLQDRYNALDTNIFLKLYKLISKHQPVTVKELAMLAGYRNHGTLRHHLAYLVHRGVLERIKNLPSTTTKQEGLENDYPHHAFVYIVNKDAQDKDLDALSCRVRIKFKFNSDESVESQVQSFVKKHGPLNSYDFCLYTGHSISYSSLLLKRCYDSGFLKRRQQKEGDYCCFVYYVEDSPYLTLLDSAVTPITPASSGSPLLTILDSNVTPMTPPLPNPFLLDSKSPISYLTDIIDVTPRTSNSEEDTKSMVKTIMGHEDWPVERRLELLEKALKWVD